MRSIFQVISLFLVFFAFAKLPAQPGFNATYDLGKSGSQFYASIIEKDTIIAFGEIVLMIRNPKIDSGGQIGYIGQIIAAGHFKGYDILQSGQRLLSLFSEELLQAN